MEEIFMFQKPKGTFSIIMLNLNMFKLKKKHRTFKFLLGTALSANSKRMISDGREKNNSISYPHWFPEACSTKCFVAERTLTGNCEKIVFEVSLFFFLSSWDNLKIKIPPILMR